MKHLLSISDSQKYSTLFEKENPFSLQTKEINNPKEIFGTKQLSFEEACDVVADNLARALIELLDITQNTSNEKNTAKPIAK